MTWHFRAGYCVLSLLLFRLIWGFAGGHWSRFSTFVQGPAKVMRYLRGQGDPTHSVGHNPAGAMSVLAMLMFLAFQVGSGMLSDDEIAAAGPLTRFVSGTIVSQATFYHKEIGKLVLIFLIVMHLFAIIFYLIKKHENLITPMITGDKVLPFWVEGSKDSQVVRLLGLVLFSACCALVGSVIIWVN